MKKLHVGLIFKGVKLGYCASAVAGNTGYPGYYKWLVPALCKILPQHIVQIQGCLSMLEEGLRYDAQMALDDLGASKIFVGETLGVAKRARGLGLGAELLKR